MSLQILLKRKFGKEEKAIIKIAEELFEKHTEIVGIESTKSWDGANLRIIVTNDDLDVIDRIMESLFKVLNQLNLVGKIVPEIVKADELFIMSRKTVNKVKKDIAEKIKYLLKKRVQGSC